LPIFERAHVSSPSILGPPGNAHHIPIHPKNICFDLLLYILLHGGQARPSCSLQRGLITRYKPQHMPPLMPLPLHLSPIYMFRLSSLLPSSRWYKRLTYRVQRSDLPQVGPYLRIIAMKTSNDTIGNRTGDLLACSAVMMTGSLLLPVLFTNSKNCFFHFSLHKQLEQKSMAVILQHMY
jgi:hypothetical protein